MEVKQSAILILQKGHQDHQPRGREIILHMLHRPPIWRLPSLLRSENIVSYVGTKSAWRKRSGAEIGSHGKMISVNHKKMENTGGNKTFILSSKKELELLLYIKKECREV
ncbi:hypothetical protein POM88_047499 [Heracleum sosnowskyi]|uniref:Uncharacterized protein n=1 Tax=Heracleum sosnowskyi TaxID=360622 RepID=A0AAD8LZK5_9APIA|nr:hypothetical protein POM88_047499 [Heracleum sosnowskyi]